MKITFCGAAKAVTGSCHMIEAAGKKLLVDCGLRQGKDEIENESFPFSPNEIDYVLVTHAHIDHTGRLPLLCKQGFSGKIIATRLTVELLTIMLKDSAHIQESEALWKNQKGKRSGASPVEPLYTMADAECAIGLMQSYDYNQNIDIAEGLEMRFQDAGHLLGSAFVELWITENGQKRKIVFSGDIGNKAQAIINDPVKIEKADYVVIESTYGNRDHQIGGNYALDLAAILDETFAKGGNVVIPSFAVGRTQELLYFMRIIKKYGLVKSFPSFPVYVDSPLARAATNIYSGDLTGYIDPDTARIMEVGEKMLAFPGLHLTESTEESRMLNTDRTPKVIISASGMCDAGRIRHHLKHNLWRPECSVIFVGFQVQGSFGRLLQEKAAAGGEQSVKLLGEEIALKASISTIKGMSGHADRTGLLEWINAYTPKPRRVFVVHGDSQICMDFAADLRGMGFAATCPDYLEEHDLTADVMVRAGIEPPRKKAAVAPKAKESAAYLRLVEMGEKLMALVRSSREWPNKDLIKFTDQIKALIHKWSR